jgi:hypothetical protein
MIGLRATGLALLVPLLTSSAAVAQPAPAGDAARSVVRNQPPDVLVVGTGRPTPVDRRSADRRSSLVPRSLPPLAAAAQAGRRPQRDSVKDGALIGAAIGAGGGYLWSRSLCGSNDSECSAITTPVGVLSGIGIGAAVGAIADLLHN